MSTFGWKDLQEYNFLDCDLIKMQEIEIVVRMTEEEMGEFQVLHWKAPQKQD